MDGLPQLVSPVACAADHCDDALPLNGSRILLDGFNLGMAKGSGIATYARNLSENLSGLGSNVEILYSIDSNPSKRSLLNEIAIFDVEGPPPRKFTMWMRGAGSAVGRFPKKVVPTGEVITRNLAAKMPKADAYWVSRDIFHTANRRFRRSSATTDVYCAAPFTSPDIDLAHWTTVLPMRLAGSRNIYTIHDVIPLRLPFVTQDQKRRFFRLCRWICRTADHVVTVSETSRDDIMRIFGIEGSRITNTYQSAGISERLLSLSDAEAAEGIENAFGLVSRGYYVFFGALEPKKNVGRVIEAYLLSGTKRPLVIVGGRAWLDEDETRLLKDELVQTIRLEDNTLRRDDRIKRFDYMPYGSLIRLVRGARATIFPSLYEGFGLPVLESMMLGTPVITSNEGALLEVAGEAALSVDPYDTAAIARAISQIENDDDLCAELSARGRVRAEVFSPAVYRQSLLDLYRKLL